MIYYLNDAGEDELAVMAVLRNTFHLSLGEAREIIAGAPAALPEISGAEAEELLERLRSFGAKVGAAPAAAAPSEQSEPAESSDYSIITSPSGFSVLVEPDPEPEPEPEPQTEPKPEPIYNPIFGEFVVKPSATPRSEEPIIKVFVHPHQEKLRMVKLVMEFLGIRLAEAKEIVDNFPEQPLPLAKSDAKKFVLMMKEQGFKTSYMPIGIAEATVAASAAPEAAPASSADTIASIEIKDPGPKRMQIIPLLKKELGYKYSQASDYAEKGGVLRDFPSQDVAHRVADALRALGATINIG